MSESDFQKFKLGRRDVALVDLLDSDFLQNLKSKFSHEAERTLWISMRELVRYLYMATYSPHSLFFPGTKLIDDIWHAVITETKEYQKLCDRLRPGTFLHHSGIKYDDYSKKIGAKEVHVEQASWLSSYVKAFGRIDAEAFDCLLMAQAMASSMNLDLEQLNSYAEVLIQLSSASQQESTFNFEDLLNSDLKFEANLIDSDRVVLRERMIQLLRSCADASQSPVILRPSELEQIYGVSTALAFTLAQHLAAIERLSGIPDWQERNKSLWQELSSASVLCGLATTHLAKPSGSSLSANETADGFYVSGSSMWVCGFEIFDKLLVGFDTKDLIVFAIIDFPNYSTDEIEITVHEMTALNGMGTVNLKFNNHFISKSAMVSSREKGNGTVSNRPSRYVIPEMGLGKRALSEVREIIKDSESPKHKLISEALPGLELRLKKIEDLRSMGMTADLVFLKDEFLRDAVRLLGVAVGPKALLKDNLVAKMQNEVMFLENPVQPPAAIAARIKKICSGQYE